MFKIVSTRRKGRVELSAVPASWENNGKLRWPKKNFELLSKSGNSLPQPDWLTYNCVLKRKDFLSYRDADEELSKMLDKTDTDDTDYYEERAHVNFNSQNKDYNSMARILIDSGSTNPVTEYPAVEAHGIDDEMYTVIAACEENAQEPPTVRVQYDDNQNTTSNELLVVITQNQEKIMKKLAEISVQLDEMNENKRPVCTLAQVKGSQQNKKFTIQPINKVEDLELFDNQLSDPNTLQNLLQKYSILCSVAEGRGFNCAYRLLDFLFSKDLLCKCSWTGGSRGPDVKVAFKRYKNIINFFFQMVNFWDCNYTVENNEEFLKSVLRNALKRKDTKNIRKSSKKSKSSKAKKDQDSLNKDDEVNTNNKVNEDKTLNNNEVNQSDVAEQNTNNDNQHDDEDTNYNNVNITSNLNIIEEDDESLC